MSTPGIWLPGLRLACRYIDLEFDLGVVGRVVGDVVGAFAVPLDIADVPEALPLLDLGDDLGKLDGFFRRNGFSRPRPRRERLFLRHI